MNQDTLLGEGYKAMYDGYYDPAISQKRAIAAEDTFSHLCEVAGTRGFESVLDVGAGEGSLLARMQAESFGLHLYAVEISTSGLEATRSRQLTRLVDAQLFDGYHIPYPDKYFDLAISIHVLEHVEHERLLLAELKRVARHVAIEVPLEGGFRVERSIGKGGPYGHINFYTPSTFLNLLRTTGLTPSKWRVGTSSMKYERYTAGPRTGLVKGILRRQALAMFPRFAPFLFTYLLTVYCSTENAERAPVESVLSPLETAINYAPHSEESLRGAVADRMSSNAVLRNVVRDALSLPGNWPVVRKLLFWVENRPGRLYSFVCHRP
jgi:SAM-dependent methyltransferase